jgi:hypothetical protein
LRRLSSENKDTVKAFPHNNTTIFSNLGKGVDRDMYGAMVLGGHGGEASSSQRFFATRNISTLQFWPARQEQI